MERGKRTKEEILELKSSVKLKFDPKCWFIIDREERVALVRLMNEANRQGLERVWEGVIQGVREGQEIQVELHGMGVERIFEMIGMFERLWKVTIDCNRWSSFWEMKKEHGSLRKGDIVGIKRDWIARESWAFYSDNLYVEVLSDHSGRAESINKYEFWKIAEEIVSEVVFS